MSSFNPNADKESFSDFLLPAVFRSKVVCQEDGRGKGSRKTSCGVCHVNRSARGWVARRRVLRHQVSGRVHLAL